jgi:hypothetical protein
VAPNPEIMGKMVNGCGPCGKVLILAREFSVIAPWAVIVIGERRKVADIKLLFSLIAVGDVAVPSVSMIMKGISVHGW